MTKEKLKEPKDLGIKIGSKSEVLWTKIKEETQMLIQQSKDSLEIQTEILELAFKKIKEEKEKFK